MPKPLMTVLRVGTWRGLYGRRVVVEQEDLQRLARDYNPDDFMIPLFLSADYHRAESGSAAGWIKALSVSGDELLAELTDVPPEVKEDVSVGRRRYVSPELITDQLDRPVSLHRVAVLGASPPGQRGLPPLDPAMFSGDPDRRVVVIELSQEPPQEDPMNKPTDTGQPKAPAAKEPVQLTQDVEERLAKLEAENTALKTKLASADGDDRVVKLQAQIDRRDMSDWAGKLVADGKLPPALKDQAVNLAASLSDDTPESGAVMLSQGDGEPRPVSQREALKALLGGLPTMLSGGAQFADPGQDDDAEAVDLRGTV